jgi:hypothetical protein
MVEIHKAVNELRDVMKARYLKDQRAIWTTPFVGFIEADDVGWAPMDTTEEALFAFAQAKRSQNKLQGIVIGRMCAKYSETIKDIEGNPQILSKAIIVSGRMFTTGKTYMSITVCREHQDLRVTENGDPVKNKPYVPGVTSPDKVQEIIDQETGLLKGFLSMQFGEEQVFDSRQGVTCTMDPMIRGVLGSTAEADAAIDNA